MSAMSRVPLILCLLLPGIATAAVERSERASFRVERIAGGLQNPWAVAFLPDGGVLAATGEGLYRVDFDGRVTSVRVGAGEAVHAVRRIGIGGGLIGVATRGGVHVSRDARAWRRLVRLPLGEATLVALRARGEASGFMPAQAW